MAKPYRYFRWRFEFGGVMVLVWAFRILPQKIANGLAVGIAGIFFYLIPKRRNIALRNLRMAFGHEKLDDEIRIIAKNCYRSLALSVVEVSKLGIMKPEEVTDCVQMESPHHLQEGLKQGRGVIALCSHSGNWEFLNAAHALQGKSSCVVARPVDNPYLNAFVNRQRKKLGSYVINSKSPRAIREIIKALSKGQTVAFLLDQNVRGDRGVFVDFFGKPAYTHKVVALIARKTGAPVVPIVGARRKDGTHYLRYEKPLDLVVSDSLERDLIVNTQRMTRRIESWVRREPEQWLWMHDRWKKQPSLEDNDISQRAVFLDRDGTITKEVGYIHDIEKLELMEGSAVAIRLLNKLGIRVIVVTNQSGVARGYYEEAHVQNVNKRMEELLSAQGAHLDGIYYCPHHPIEGKGAYTFSCDCRKPEPGLLYQAEERCGVRLSQSFVVGDKETDITLARRVGATGIMVLTGYGTDEIKEIRGFKNRFPDFVVNDLFSAARLIVEQLEVG